MDQYFLIIVEKIYIMIYEVSVNQESEKETGIIYFIPVFLKYIYIKNRNNNDNSLRNIKNSIKCNIFSF